MKATTIVTLGLTTVLATACGGNGGSRYGKIQEALEVAQIMPDEALAAAANEVPDARLIGFELEVEGGSPTYVVEVVSGDQIIEVVIDPMTAEVITSGPDDEEDGESEPIPPVCDGIALLEAVAIAEAEANGHIVEIEQEDCNWEGEVTTPTKLVEVLIAPDGAVLEIGKEKDDGKDD